MQTIFPRASIDRSLAAFRGRYHGRVGEAQYGVLRIADVNQPTLQGRDIPPDPLTSVVDRRVAVRLDGDQLHRPADAFAACPLLQAGLPMDQHRLREYRDRLPRRLLPRADALRPADGPHRHEARADDFGGLVLGRLDVDLPGGRVLQLCALQVLVRGRGVGQLAGGDQGRVGVVPQTGT